MADIPTTPWLRPPAWLALVHVWLPVLLAPALGSLMAAQGHRPLSVAALTTFSAGALAVYTLDRLSDADGAGSASDLLQPWRAPLAVIACAAGLLCALLLVVHRQELWSVGCALILLSLGYPLMRALPLGKTIAVALAWTLAAHQIAGNGPWGPRDCGLALTIAASTIACDLKDEQQDRTSRIRSLPALLGGRWARALALVLLLAAGALALTQHAVGLIVLALGQVLPLRLAVTARPVVGPLLVDALLVLVAGLGGWVIR